MHSFKQFFAFICVHLRIKKSLFYSLLVCVSLGAGSAQAANDRAFFWQVSSPQAAAKKATVYLLGSIHFADKSFYPLRPEIEKAYEQSKALVVELDIDRVDMAEYKRLVQTRGSYTDGRTLKDVLGEKTLADLQRQLQKMGIDYAQLKSLKPGLVVMTLSSVQMMQLGFEPELGIDMHFLVKAKADGKKVIELESLQQQLDLFLDIPDGDLLLKETLYSMEKSETMIHDMITYWKAGDDKALKRLLFDDAARDYPEFSKLYDALFYQRNRRMLKKIQAMLKRGGSYFVIVGAGHLVGEEGLVSLLRAEGNEVQRR